jgi:hypothetical protein
MDDLARSDLKGHIYFNESKMSQSPTALKRWVYGHECGHYQKGLNETAADCWSIRTGKQQGWFRESDFSKLEAVFANNPGDLTHPPGPMRIENMKKCFGLSSAKNQDKDVTDRFALPARPDQAGHAGLAPNLR